MDFFGMVVMLCTQVTKWLDEEWIPQECHRAVAQIAAGEYLKVGVEVGVGVWRRVGTIE